MAGADRRRARRRAVADRARGAGEASRHLRALRRRASQLEVRVALARSAGNPHAFVVPRPSIRAGTLALWVLFALAGGLLGGWVAHRQWGRPGGGATLEESRGTIVVH